MLRGRTRTFLVMAAVAVLGVSLTGCSATGVLNTLEPRFGVATTRNLAYASGPRHGVDVYAPKTPAPHAPVLVFVYGGGWDMGSKSQYASSPPPSAAPPPPGRRCRPPPPCWKR